MIRAKEGASIRGLGALASDESYIGCSFYSASVSFSSLSSLGALEPFVASIVGALSVEPVDGVYTRLEGRKGAISHGSILFGVIRAITRLGSVLGASQGSVGDVVLLRGSYVDGVTYASAFSRFCSFSGAYSELAARYKFNKYIEDGWLLPVPRPVGCGVPGRVRCYVLSDRAEHLARSIDEITAWTFAKYAEIYACEAQDVVKLSKKINEERKEHMQKFFGHTLENLDPSKRTGAKRKKRGLYDDDLIDF